MTPAAKALLLGLALLLAAPAAKAAPDCASAAAAEEAAAGVPAKLLLAIGMVESGWTNPATGRRAPWPYSVNVDGKGYRFGSAAAATDFVRLAQASGAKFIDVGCFQIDLRDHPDAFANLEQAFDPVLNARYAAGFLSRLHARLGSWEAAAAGYHSQIPSLGLPYERLVLAVWHGGARASILPLPASRADPYVVRIAANASGLPQVITP